MEKTLLVIEEMARLGIIKAARQVEATEPSEAFFRRMNEFLGSSARPA